MPKNGHLRANACFLAACNREVVKITTSITTNAADGFITAANLRNRWQVSGMFIWRMRRSGKLNAYRIGSRGLRFALAEIEKIERGSMTSKGPCV